MSSRPLPLVTIGLPIYRRFEYLLSVLKIVEAQDYPNIDLLVSDNGMNGDRVREIVAANYPRPFRFRQNPATVDMVTHFNQLVREAQGTYYFLLCDDDEISPNYISALVGRLEANPRCAIAFGAQEVVDLSGRLVTRSSPTVPEFMSGPDFILATWRRYEFGFKSVSAYLARTERMRSLGGYPQFSGGTHEDDALVVLLSLEGGVALNGNCVWRNRLYEASFGMAISIDTLAAATREFLDFLRTSSTLQAFAVSHPVEARQIHSCLIRMAWQTYHRRWATMYRGRMSNFEWVRAGFALPFLPAYYREVARTFRAQLQRFFSPPVPLGTAPNLAASPPATSSSAATISH